LARRERKKQIGEDAGWGGTPCWGGHLVLLVAFMRFGAKKGCSYTRISRGKKNNNNLEGKEEGLGKGEEKISQKKQSFQKGSEKIFPKKSQTLGNSPKRKKKNQKGGKGRGTKIPKISKTVDGGGGWKIDIL